MSVLNIVELQNVITSASGVSPIGYLSNQVTNIQQIVRYDLKQINVNSISNFDTSPIQVYSDLNLCNVGLSLNGGTFSGSGTTGVSSFGTSTTGLLTLGISMSTGLLFQQGLISSFYIDSNTNATFTGTVTASNFITASDLSLKKKINRITDYETILSSVNGVRFEWTGSGLADIGVLAQEVLPVLPEAVEGTEGSYKVAYLKFVPVLIEAVKNLQRRVSLLEKNCSADP
jgi:hypothetical protein